LWGATWTGLVGAAHAECRVQSSVDQIKNAVDEAEAAYGALDKEGFMIASDRLRLVLPCLKDTVSPELAARVHRTEGFRRFGERDFHKASLSFAATRATDPGVGLPPNLVPPSHPIRSSFSSVDVTIGEMRQMAIPEKMELFCGGLVCTDRSADWPTLVQVISSKEVVQSTHLLEASEPDPWLVDLEIDTPAPKTAKVASSPESGADTSRLLTTINVPMAASAGVTLIASGVLYSLAHQSSEAYWDPNAKTSELVSLRDQTNRRMMGATAAVGTGVGLIVGSVVMGQW